MSETYRQALLRVLEVARIGDPLTAEDVHDAIGYEAIIDLAFAQRFIAGVRLHASEHTVVTPEEELRRLRTVVASLKRRVRRAEALADEWEREHGEYPNGPVGFDYVARRLRQAIADRAPDPKVHDLSGPYELGTGGWMWACTCRAKGTARTEELARLGQQGHHRAALGHPALPEDLREAEDEPQ